MATSTLDELLRKADALTSDEQLWLITQLAEKVRAARPGAKPRRKWREIAGTAPYPLAGEEAQDWVTRTRLEATEQREARWRREA
jgi:hypothetical protein